MDQKHSAVVEFSKGQIDAALITVLTGLMTGPTGGTDGIDGTDRISCMISRPNDQFMIES